MADTVFYSTEERRNERPLRILSVGSLVSKPPTKEKRISIKVRMPLSGVSNMGAPSWLDHAFTYVAQNHDVVSPVIEFKGYDLTFSADNLFGTEVKCPNGAMRKFSIFEAGDAENPDVVCEFLLRVGFSTAAWDWLGQFVGDDVFVKFVPGEPGKVEAAEQDGTLLDDGENDEDEDEEPEGEDDEELDEESELDPDSGRVVVMPPAKSGPKDLAAFHENEVAKEQKRGRGRPRKVVDPLTVNAPTQPF